MNRKKLRQIDVANAFLYAPVDAEIFVELPHGSNADPSQVCQLEKSLNGIKQAPRLWQQHLHARLIHIGFLQLPHDQGMYRLTKGTDYILLIVYVDDLLYIGSTDETTTWFEGELQRDLTLTVATTMTQYMGLNIQDDDNAIYLRPLAPRPLGPATLVFGPSAPPLGPLATTAAAPAATAASTAPECCATMASLRVLVFDHEGRPVAFDTWHDDLQLYLLSDIKDSVSLFDHVSGVAPAPPATADSATPSQWQSCDATARLAIRNHLPVAECTHFGQHRPCTTLSLLATPPLPLLL
ncbi:unnamed protein product [Closterium sp. NIES-54]